MYNRRNRPYSYRPSQRTSVTTHKTSMGISFKPWFFAVAILVIGLYLVNRGNTETADVKKSEQSATAASVERKATEKKQDSQSPFPTIDTKGFSVTQEKMLEQLKIEYAKKPKSYDKTVLMYTEGVKQSWCGDFISYIRFEADKPFKNPETGYWRIPGVMSMRDYYAKSKNYHLVGSYKPKFGDVAFYFGETPDGSSREHVAIVLEVRGDTLVTIGGNETEKGILQIRYDKMKQDVKGLTGFGESVI